MHPRLSRITLLLSLSATAGCFDTNAINGLPCESDDDCGPLACVEGVCGGDSGAGSEGAEEESTSTDATSGDGDSTSGDGDSTTGDGDSTSGDGDSTSGDGDSTSGDGDSTTGDGDSTSGDGDSTTGDGDSTSGDGDSTTGDGDSTTGGDGDGGDGDGDGDGDPVCGNGIVEGDEICDDGTDFDTDECTTDCVVRASELELSFNVPVVGIPFMDSTDEGETYIAWNDGMMVDSAKIDLIGALSPDPLNATTLGPIADIEAQGTEVVLIGRSGATFAYELYRDATDGFDARTPTGPVVATQYATASYLDRGWISGSDNTSSFDAVDLLVDANFGANGTIRWDDHNERLVGIVGSGVSVWNGMNWQDLSGPLMKDISDIDIGPSGEVYFSCKESGMANTPCTTGAIQKVTTGGQVVPVVDNSAFAFDAISVDGHNSRIVAMSQGSLIYIPINMPRFSGRKRWPTHPDVWGHYTLNEGSGTVVTSFADGDDGVVTGTADWGDTYFEFDGDTTIDLPEFTDSDVESFTLDARILPNGIAGGIFAYEPNFVLDLNIGRPRFRLRTASGMVEVEGNTLLSVSQWHDIRVTFDGNELRLAIDGSFVDTATVTSAVEFGNSQCPSAFIGGSCTGDAFVGRIDEVRLISAASTLAW